MNKNSSRTLLRYPMAGLALVLALTGCTPTTEAADATSSSPSASTSITVESEDTGAIVDVSEPVTAPAPEATAATATGSARNALDTLAVKGRAPKTGYSREQFGAAWTDVDRNGCDQRNDVLNRDLEVASHKPGTDGCVVLTGTLDDPFTGTVIDFTRGQSTSSDVQIDHTVALSDGWQKGAQQLSDDDRVAFANDPLNLMAVDGPANGQKSDSDAASWLPANTAFRCDYVARQVAVKVKYELWVTQAEHDAIDRVLDSCPGQELPDAGTTYDITPGMAASAEQTTAPATESDALSAGGPFQNCAAAKAAGAAPVKAGDPGYGTHLDQDGDGVGCES